jgi:ABC-2 type transport system ATP-binding protein
MEILAQDLRLAKRGDGLIIINYKSRAGWHNARRPAAGTASRLAPAVREDPIPRESMLLRTVHLTKDYNGFRALDDFNLTVKPGEAIGLLGPNGSGKSTALRLILGFLRPTTGHAYIADHDCWRAGVAARKNVAYLPGELRLYENMTGRQLIDFLAKLREAPIKADIEELARRLDIDLDRPIVQLSSGMKRKVALIQVLAPHTPLLILDEPTNTLDPTMRDELMAQLINARNHGQAVLFSSHVLSEVEHVCDRVGILQRGKLVHLQDMAELRDANSVFVRFSRPLVALPEAKGLKVREKGEDYIKLEHTGSMQPLLEWLASQSVAELRVEPLGLSAIYHRYHGVAD